jgi:hypothetical protein
MYKTGTECRGWACLLAAGVEEGFIAKMRRGPSMLVKLTCVQEKTKIKYRKAYRKKIL